VVLGYEEKGADSIEQRWRGVQQPEERPLSRGEDSKTKYIKSFPGKKEVAVQMHDQMIVVGCSSRDTIKHMQSDLERFCNRVAASVTALRKAANSCLLPVVAAATTG
jgi:hypothetical protein